MNIKKLIAGAYGANCYFLLDEKSKEMAIIDPGDEGERIIEAAKTLDGKVKYILFTHGHVDHVGAAEVVREYFKAPLCIHKKDADMIGDRHQLFGAATKNGEPLAFDQYLSEGDVLSLGETKIRCIETPGHTPGGMCFATENFVVTGDTLFFNSIGRTDFIGGNYEQLIDSIQSKLMCMEDGTEVYPGHGPASTIKNERENNPFLRGELW